jgi:hypothetical protein
MRIPLLLYPLFVLSVGMAFSQDTNFANGPQYLMTAGSPQYARPISTPSMSLSALPLQVGATNATDGLVTGPQNGTVSRSQPDAPPQVDLFPIYYGTAWAGEFKISLPPAESVTPLPASIADTGAWQFTTAQALRERGYGVTIVEFAAYEKAHAQHASRVYTNADIERLHDGG